MRITYPRAGASHPPQNGVGFSGLSPFKDHALCSHANFSAKKCPFYNWDRSIHCSEIIRL